MPETLNNWDTSHAARWVADAPGEYDHKYTRGVLGMRTGSAEFPGAAVLGVEAAWRTGLGMVRYLPPERRAHDTPVDDPLCRLVLQRRPETVVTEGRTDAWLLGSGVSGGTLEAHGAGWFAELCRGSAPVIIDAGAIEAVGRMYPVAAPAIITPHAGEFAALVTQLDLRTDSGHGEVARETLISVAKRLGATVLLKGSVTRIATPNGRVGQVGPATPWLATAGTGDVLAGILGALTARHHAALQADPELFLEVGLSAALLHDTAARIASESETRPITALDVAEAIPAAIRTFAA